MDEQNQAETIGQYRLTECHAEGRIARLCKGVDRVSGQKVLVRIVDPLAGRSEPIRAILEELRDPASPRRVQDPHILRLLDVGLKDDTYYVIHEDFGGVSLDEHLGKGRPTLREALGLAYSIAECLRAVHGHRIIHGDLKPQNILVATTRQERSHVKVALSDLAHEAADAMVSVYGELVGTPKYMAPEVLRGGRGTAQSDLFSLGVILYELFSGRAPFPGDTPISYIHANVSTTPVPLTMADSAVPADLGRVVSRLLERDPRNRYRNVQGLIDDLERVAARLDGVTPEPAAPGADSIFTAEAQPSRPASNPWRAVAVFSLAASAIMLLVVVLLILSRMRPPATPGVIPLEPTPATPSAPPDLTGVPPALLPPSNREELIITQPAPAEGSLETARSLVVAGKEDEAIEYLRSLRATAAGAPRKEEIDNQIAAALLSKANRLDRAGQSPQALEVLEPLIRDYPNAPATAKARDEAADILLARAQLLANHGRLEEAVAYLERIQTQYPRSNATLKALQLLPATRVRFAESILNTDPDRAANILREVAFSPASSEDVSRARTLLSKHLFAQSDRQMRRGAYEEAVIALREARQMDPALQDPIAQREPEALGQLALAQQRQGKPAEAVATWRELQEKYPTNIWVTRVRVEIAALLEATASLAQGEQAGDAAMLMALAEKSLKVGDFAAAQPQLEQLVATYPDTPEGRRAAQLLSGRILDAALVALRAGEIGRARELFNQVAGDYPNTQAGVQAKNELARFNSVPPGMVFIPAGPCTIGLSPEQVDALVTQFSIPRLMVPRWFGTTMPAHTANLPAFCIDIDEVTNAEYKAFVDATHRDPPPSPDWEEGNVKPAAEKRPVRYVSWDDATAYAAWAGKRLPTEAEWEKAARGPTGLLFPWGNEFDASRCMTATGESDGPLPVGSVPDNRSPYGALDMVGSLRQWTQDSLTPYPDADQDAARFSEALKVARGSGWNEINSFFCLAAMRTGYSPGTKTASLGFRCAADAK